jgi:3-deoxy-D-manno-octulosonate cytidylyltransferase
VIVVTDSDIIYNEITSFGGKAMMSCKEHICGSDRIAEAAEQLPDVDIVVNIQGDEPFTKREPLEKLLSVFYAPDAATIDLASLMQRILRPEQIDDPNYVKVVTDQHQMALLFSRSRIPYPRNPQEVVYYEHIGIYAFRRHALIDFYHTAETPLEKAEKIECLRYLERGKKMKMVEVPYMGIEIDTPQDLIEAEKYVNSFSKTINNNEV